MSAHIREYLKKPLPNPHISTHTREILIFCCVLCALLLSGCSAAGDFILHRSGVISEEDYQKYIELRNAGQLDDNGSYTAEELTAEPELMPPDGSVHVTFAENEYMTVQYYLDEELKTPVDPQLCYLRPGERIYAAVPECRHPSSNWYTFDRFCVYAHDAEGTRGEELPWGNETLNSGVVLQIPEDCTTTEVSVVPMGKYEKRLLELSDYYTDSVDREQKPGGTWIINEKEVSANVLSVSPVEPLVVDYKYDSKKYDFVTSTPNSFYHKNGLVRFETTYATEDIERYTVELRPLEGRFLFEPDNYWSENGTIQFKYAGKVITEPEYIPDGRTIEYIATPNPGYDCAERTGKITVNSSDPDKTIAEIQKVTNFYKKREVNVFLPQPNAGGTIEYTANGKTLSSNPSRLLSGTKIKMEFKNWNGWTKNAKVMGKETYTVTDQEEGQSVSLEGLDIRTEVFTEADKHKPTLNVILAKSVKGELKFDINASGAETQTELAYTLGNSPTIFSDNFWQGSRNIFSGKIGTYPGVKLTIKDDTILSGYALKLDIVMKDTRGNKYRAIRYIKELPVEEEIELYAKTNAANDSKVYETVTVTVSEVEVVTYRSKSVENAEISAVLNDITTPYALKDGDILEPSRKVEITVDPKDGYHVSGAKGNDSGYRETMKYSKWEKDWQKILNKHPVQKKWYVTLNSTDNYGVCVYRLDGAVVSGMVEVHEGQKLTLEYTLTDPNRKIVRKGIWGVWGSVTRSGTESQTIPISEALDGQTIQRSDYIKVE